jgi:hypothetical protein
VPLCLCGSLPFRFEFGDLFAMHDVSNLYRAAADFAVFEISLAAHRSVEHDRNLFAAIRTSKEVFHKRTCVLTYQGGSCKQSRQQED